MNAYWAVHLKLLGMAVLWGVSWILGKIVIQELPPVSAGALRFLLAAAALWLWLQASGQGAAVRQLSARQWAGLAACAVSGVYGYAICFLTGLKYMPAGEAAVIVALNPVLVMLLSRIIFKEKITPRTAIGMTLAFCGSLICLTRGRPDILLQQNLGMGQLLILGCVLCWACYTITGRFVLKGISAPAATCATSLIGGVLLAATALAAEPDWPQQMAAASAGAWISLLVLSLGATAVAYMWFFEGVKILGTATSGSYITLVPVFAVITSMLFLGEPLHASLLSGGLLAVSGMLMMYWKAKA